MTVVPDYSYARFSGARLRQLGFEGVVRYACAGRDPVNITAREADDLKANGLKIGLTVEHEPNWLLLDPGSVRERVQGAVTVARNAGLSGPLLLACDFDITLGGPPVSGVALGYMNQLLRGLQAAASVLSANTGLYGSAYAIDWVAAHSMIGNYWQTIGWSGGYVTPRAALLQDRVNTKLDGQDVDFSSVRGNWPYCWAPQRVNVPAQPQVPGHVDVKTVQSAVHATADGVWGPQTDRNCELVRLAPHCNIAALQGYSLGFSGRAVDGVVGPQTVLASLAAIQGIQRGLGVAADGKWGPQTQAAYVAASPFR